MEDFKWPTQNTENTNNELSNEDELTEFNNSSISDVLHTNEEIQAIDENINRFEDFNADEQSSKKTEDCTALTVRKEHRLLVAQTMFKKSIKISIKSFLISLSLTFLNFFI